MTSECVRCGRPTADGYACSPCANRAGGPAEQKYLGRCGADACGTCGCAPGWHVGGKCRNGQRLPHRCEGDFELVECTGDIYAYRGAATGRCRSCGATVATAEREAWLDDEVRQHAFPARHIADAYGINVKTIRTWALRGHLRSYYRTAGGIIAEWTDSPDGETRERLHYVGDVLDLAAADAARRETDRARRERRRTTRHEGDAA